VTGRAKEAGACRGGHHLLDSVPCTRKGSLRAAHRRPWEVTGWTESGGGLRSGLVSDDGCACWRLKKHARAGDRINKGWAASPAVKRNELPRRRSISPHGALGCVGRPPRRRRRRRPDRQCLRSLQGPRASGSRSDRKEQGGGGSTIRDSREAAEIADAAKRPDVPRHTRGLEWLVG
jgi:hypothetical protein